LIEKYRSQKSRLSMAGIVLSILIHAAIFALPLALLVTPRLDREKSIDLVFKEPEPPPKPKPKPPPPKPRPKPKPLKSPPKPQPEPEPPPKQSPIEADPAETGGIDIPTGPAYEEVYVPPGPECGNGEVEEGEQCDDGNTSPGDGCSAGCMLEYVPACGNGVLDQGEECDDGNTSPGDGCSPGCAKEIDREKVLDEYRKKLFATIERNKQYPPVARRRGIQGAVGIGFTIHRDGSADGVSVTKPSGYGMLDEAAVETIHRAGKLPPPPPELGMETIRLEIVIVFKLQ